MEINLHDACLIALVIHICAVRAIAHLHFGHKNAVAIFLVLELEAGGGVEKNIVFAYIFTQTFTRVCARYGYSSKSYTPSWSSILNL